MDPNNSGVPALASNPANGINNIPLGGEQIEGVTETELQELLQEVLASKDNFQVLADKVANVDHCHTTGKIRGLLCRKCNTAIGLLNDNATVLRLAAEYLDEHASA